MDHHHVFSTKTHRRMQIVCLSVEIGVSSLFDGDVPRRNGANYDLCDFWIVEILLCMSIGLLVNAFDILNARHVLECSRDGSVIK